jgi:hypothetical protein
MTHRIEPAAYAGFVLVSLAALIALILRWRSQSSTRLAAAAS